MEKIEVYYKDIFEITEFDKNGYHYVRLSLTGAPTFKSTKRIADKVKVMDDYKEVNNESKS